MLHTHDRRSLAAAAMCETGIDAVLIFEDGILV
jgi:hypothetical protein